MTSLVDHRSEIDTLDSQIIELIGKRFAVAREVAEHKRDEGIPMMQSDRVEDVLARAEALAREHSFSPALARQLYSEIVDETCHVEDDIIAGRSSGDDDAPGNGAVGNGASSNGAVSAPSKLCRHALSIDHVAIAVRELAGAVDTFCGTFGFELVEERTVEGSFSGMRSAVLRAGDVKLVLVQGTSPESNVSKYIDHYGPGVQHVAIEVDDADTVLDDLRERGCDLLTGIIHGPGLDQIFTRREPNSGMQVEVIARADNDGFSASNVQELFEAMERENVY